MFVDRKRCQRWEDGKWTTAIPNGCSHPFPPGLTAGQVADRKEKGLQNIQPQHQTKTVGQIFRDNIFTLFNAFNFGLAVCIAAVGAYENLLFMLVIIVNTAIGIVQEIRSKRMDGESFVDLHAQGRW